MNKNFVFDDKSERLIHDGDIDCSRMFARSANLTVEDITQLMKINDPFVKFNLLFNRHVPSIFKNLIEL